MPWEQTRVSRSVNSLGYGVMKHGPCSQQPTLPLFPEHPSLPFCFPESDVFIIQHAPENKHRTRRACGSLLSFFFSASLLMQGSLSNTVPVSTVVRSCTACIWPSVKLHRLFPFPTATVKSRLLFVAKPSLDNRTQRDVKSFVYSTQISHS